jgi:hypothetical protein
MKAGEAADATRFSEPRMFADQFQRDGVILGQRFGVRNGDTGAVS